MTESGRAATEKVAYTFIDAQFPWLPKPKITEWDNLTVGTNRYYATATTISVPKYSDAWNDGRFDLVIHEVGHVVVFFCSQFGEVLTPFLVAMGGDPAIRQHPLMNEIIAEHFARAYVVGYAGANYPQLVGLVPFDIDKTRAFFQSLKSFPTAVPTGGRVAPVVLLTPAGPAPSVLVRDIRAELPFDAANLPWPINSPKTSTTVHWPGGEFDVQTDDDARNLIWAFAEEHINKDWAPQIPGAQGGAGLMYAEVIAPSGTVFLTRDPDANLWHSNDSVGNSTSRPILVLCGNERPPTPAQLRSLRSRIVGQAAFPHSIWTQTQCPGDALRAFLAGDMAVEGEDVAFKDDPDAQAFAKDVKDSLDAIKAVLATQAHHKHLAAVTTTEPQ